MVFSLNFAAYGVPAPQGSKRAFVNKRTGKAQMAEQTGEHTTAWRSTVTEAALKRIAEYGHWDPFTYPVCLTVFFVFRRPKSHYRTGKNAHLLKPDAPICPVSGRQGDLSKLVRAVEDSLTDAGVWTDDKLVARYGYRTGKYWCEDQPYLGTPGAWFDIRSIEGNDL